MPTLEEVNHQISKLEGTSTLGTRKEVGLLPDILTFDETILALTTGYMDGKTWLVVCTDRRIIFLDHGFFYGLKHAEIPIDKLSSVEHETGLFFGSISLWDGANKTIIRNIRKGTLRPFIRAVNEAIDLHKKNIPGRRSMADELRKLADLKQEGFISYVEFESLKAKLLEKNH